MLIMLFICTVAGITTSECYDVTCGTGITTDQCVSVTGSTVEIRGCKAGYYCDFSILGDVSEWKNVSCKYLYNRITPCSAVQSNLKAGYYCCKDSECKSDSCSNNRCKGKSENDKCEVSSDCNKNLYCDDEKCKKVKGSDESCSKDDECKAGYVCNKEKCTQMFSLGPGEKSDNSKACASNFQNDGKCENIQIYQGDKKLQEPYECEIGSKCIYKLTEGSGVYKTSSCVCGGNSTGKGYCSEYVRYTKSANQMLEEMRYSSSECSGSSSHTLDPDILYMCESISFSQFKKYKKYMGQLLYHSLFADESLHYCATSSGLYDPYYSFKSKDDSGHFLSIVYLLLIILVN